MGSAARNVAWRIGLAYPVTGFVCRCVASVRRRCSLPPTCVHFHGVIYETRTARGGWGAGTPGRRDVLGVHTPLTSSCIAAWRLVAFG